jgi:hypothetical protein
MRPLQQRHYTPKEVAQQIQRGAADPCGKKTCTDLWWRFSVSIDDEMEPVRKCIEFGLKT